MRFKLLLLFLFPLLTVNAQVRTKKEIKKMIKSGYETDCIYDDVYMFDKISSGKSISLSKSTFKDFTLNTLETALLKNYEDVILTEAVPVGYFVKSGNAFGLYDLQGNIIVPPIPGYPRVLQGTGMLYMGDTSPMRDWQVYIENARGKERRAYSGSFATVLDRETLKPVIPLGLFDEIHFTMKGISSYYYVSRIDDKDVLWGVCSKKGEVLVPCEYSYVKLEKGGYVGDNSQKMEDVMAEYKVVLERRNYRNEHQFELIGKAIADVASAIGNAFVAVGEGIVSLDESMQKSGGYDAINSLASYYGYSSTNSYSSYPSANDSSSHNSSSSSNTSQRQQNSISEQTNYNRDKQTYSECDSRASRWRYGSVSHSDSERRSTGDQMRRLRSKWEEKGKSFPHSSNEEWCLR